MSSTEALQPDKDAVLYLVDASVSMRRSGALAKVITAITSSIRLIERLGDRHFDTGVILYDCVAPENRSSFQNVYVAMRISHPRINDLKNLLSLRTDTFEPSAPNSRPLANGLQQAKLELAELKPSSFRRLVIITDDDDPPGLKDVQLLTQDLVNMNVLFVPIFLEHADTTFDASLFWSHLLYLPPSLSMASRNSGLNVSLLPYNVDQLESDFAALVQSKAERKPTVFRGELVLENLRIGVAAYRIVGRHTSPRTHHVQRKGDKLIALAATTNLVDKVTREPIDPSKITRRFVVSAGESVPVAPAELETLTNLRPNSPNGRLIIQSFISMHKLPFLAETRGSSVLIVPSNYQLENSKTAFASLKRGMMRKNVVASAVFLAKSPKKPPVHGFLYASDPFPDPTGWKRELFPGTQGGMFFVEQPYADDIRYQDCGLVPASGKAGSQGDDTIEALNVALSRLVRKFRVSQGFDPAYFSNPAVIQASQVFESVALNEDISPSEPPDVTRPNYKKIAKNASQLCSVIRELLSGFEENETPTKKHKPLELSEFRAAHSIGRLHCFTVPELKWALKERGLSIVGRKGELIDRLAQHL